MEEALDLSFDRLLMMIMMMVIFIGVRIIKERPGSVAIGTPCILNEMFTISLRLKYYLCRYLCQSFCAFGNVVRKYAKLVTQRLSVHFMI